MKKMTRFNRFLAQVIFMAALTPMASISAEYTSVTLPGGVTLEFAVVLPDSYTEDREWPSVLAFPPGGQNKAMVNSDLGSVGIRGQASGIFGIQSRRPHQRIIF
jgi:hypothetical protein